MSVDVIAGRFALCDPLASGSSGTVWRAWDLRERRYCAAKVLRQRDSGDLIRFTREQSVRLAHQHVLTPYTWVAEDAHVLIANELATGGSAATLVGDWGALGADTVADLLDQLLDGLAQVHEMGLVHRDVKLGNLVLDAGPDPGPGRLRLRLADFGLAVRSTDARLTQLGLVLGTPGYLSPEARRGATPDAAQDLYAAGVCAVALLRGAEPVDTDRPHGADGPGRLGMVLDALLQPDPRRRLATATQAREQLVARPVADPRTAAGEQVAVVAQVPELPPGWDADGPASARQPAGEVPLADVTDSGVPRRRRRTVYTVAAGILAVAGISLGAVLLHGGHPDSPGSHQSSPAPSSAGSGDATATPSPSITAGAQCTWQDEGTEVTVSGDTAHGVTLRCTRSGSNYVWQKV